MHLPVMPPVKPMLAKSVPRGARPGRVPGRRAVRAEVGRLPLHRLPRRRRGRARVAQRAAAHPLLPRGRRRGAAASCRSGAWSTARSSSPPARRWTSSALQQRIHPAESRVRPAGRRDAGIVRGLRPARPRRRGPDGHGLRRAPAPRLEEALAGARRAGPPDARDRRRRPWRGTGSRCSRAPGWTASSPSPPTLAVPAERARDAEGQAPAHGRLRRGRLPLAHVRPGRRLAAARPVRRQPAACSTSACAGRSPRPAAGSWSTSWRRTGPTT